MTSVGWARPPRTRSRCHRPDPLRRHRGRRRRQPAPQGVAGRRSPIRCPGRWGLAPQLHEGTFERTAGSARFACCAVGDSIRRYADVLLVGNSVGRVPVKPVPAPLGGIAPGTSGTRGFGGSFHTCQFAQVVRTPSSRRLSRGARTVRSRRSGRSRRRLAFGEHVCDSRPRPTNRVKPSAARLRWLSQLGMRRERGAECVERGFPLLD